MSTASILSQNIIRARQHLQKHGYAIIPNFLSKDICEQAEKEIDRLVDSFEPTPESTTIFDARHGKTKNRTKYFLDAVDKIHFFFEPKAWQNGKLIVPMRQAINRIGYAVHDNNQLFGNITHSQTVQYVAREVGLVDPVVLDSIVVLKPPRIGGMVNIHQDSTFLMTEPDTIMGFWLPFQDSTLQNGCLWGIPGSHKAPLYKKSKYINSQTVDQLLHEPDYKDSDFVPLQMQKGDLVIFTGRFIHKSEDNLSDRSRYAYTWHCMSGHSKWSPDNWMQRTFRKLKRD